MKTKYILILVIISFIVATVGTVLATLALLKSVTINSVEGLESNLKGNVRLVGHDFNNRLVSSEITLESVQHDPAKLGTLMRSFSHDNDNDKITFSDVNGKQANFTNYKQNNLDVKFPEPNTAGTQLSYGNENVTEHKFSGTISSDNITLLQASNAKLTGDNETLTTVADALQSTTTSLQSTTASLQSTTATLTAVNVLTSSGHYDIYSANVQVADLLIGITWDAMNGHFVWTVPNNKKVGIVCTYYDQSKNVMAVTRLVLNAETSSIYRFTNTGADDTSTMMGDPSEGKAFHSMQYTITDDSATMTGHIQMSNGFTNTSIYPDYFSYQFQQYVQT
jgi:hypothetical protein